MKNALLIAAVMACSAADGERVADSQDELELLSEDLVWFGEMAGDVYGVAVAGETAGAVEPRVAESLKKASRAMRYRLLTAQVRLGRLRAAELRLRSEASGVADGIDQLEHSMGDLADHVAELRRKVAVAWTVGGVGGLLLGIAATVAVMKRRNAAQGTDRDARKMRGHRSEAGGARYEL